MGHEGKGFNRMRQVMHIAESAKPEGTFVHSEWFAAGDFEISISGTAVFRGKQIRIKSDTNNDQTILEITIVMYDGPRIKYKEIIGSLNAIDMSSLEGLLLTAIAKAKQ